MREAAEEYEIANKRTRLRCKQSRGNKEIDRCRRCSKSCTKSSRKRIGKDPLDTIEELPEQESTTTAGSTPPEGVRGEAGGEAGGGWGPPNKIQLTPWSQEPPRN